jgi:hypothetical protein
MRLLTLLLLAVSTSAWAGPAVIFAGVSEAGAILGLEDEYVRATRPLERMAKLRRTRPVDTAEYRRYLSEQALEWSDAERERLAPLAARTESFLEKVRARMPARVLLIKARDVMDGAPHTRTNAIVLPQAFLDGASSEQLAYVIAHELSHLLTRYDDQARDRLYKAIGFLRCERVELPAALERLRVTNPDAPADRHAIRVRYKGKKVEAMPVSLLRSDKLNAADGFLANWHAPWLLVERREGACRATGKRVEPHELEGLYEQIGRNTDYLVHPEEIVAENFALLALETLTGQRLTLPTPEVARRIRRLVF